MPRSLHAPIRFAVLLAALLAGEVPAQGFPGGSGNGPPGHGPRRGAPPAAAPAPREQPAAADPLAVFFTELRTLRVALLIRDDQAEAWAAMRDALRAYVDLAATPRSAPVDAADPLPRLADLAALARERAAILSTVAEHVDTLAGRLDARQRQAFLQALDAAFARPRPSLPGGR